MTENGETRALTVQNQMVLPDRRTIETKLRAIREFQTLIKSQLIAGHDYGVIPGTTQPTLLKPGAEKTAKLLDLDDKYDILSQVENWDKPFFAYTVRCRLVSIFNPEIELSQGLGECNSYEAKYRWRDAKRSCPVCSKEAIIKGKEQYGGGWLCFKKLGGCGATFGDSDPKIISQVTGRVENEDIFSQVNTLLKMAKKRALVDAALSAGRLSDIFTQDMDDDESIIEGEAHEVPSEPQERAQEPRSAAQPRPASPRPAQPASAPVATGPSDAASAQQRAYIERLLADVGMEYNDLRAIEELRTLPAWDALTVGSVPLAVDWLLQRKKQLASAPA